ncbi:MAG: recombination protein NinG [Burkholderiaceae bacterium]
MWGAFSPNTSTQVVCGLRCAKRVPVIARNTLKADRIETRRKLDGLKPLSHWVKLTQAAFNGFIRARDAGKPCISCGRHHVGSWDAGHYLTTGARPELRFDEDNVHRQCVPCNQHLHGNHVLYRIGLIARRGLAVVERLEGPHAPKKYTVDELAEIRKDCRAKERQLKAAA